MSGSMISYGEELMNRTFRPFQRLKSVVILKSIVMLKSVVIFLGLALLTVSLLTDAAFASSGFNYSMYEAGQKNLEPALQRAAARFFPGSPPGHLYTVLSSNKIEMHADGIEFDNYEVSLDTGDKLGTFTRMRLVAGSECRIDVAFLMRSSLIADAMVLRIPVLNNKSFSAFENIVAALKGRSIDVWAREFSGFCKSLITLSRQCATDEELGSKLGLGNKTFAKQFLESLGEPVDLLPDFTVTTTTGTQLTAPSLRGKPLLIFNGSVTSKDSLDMYMVLRQLSAKGELAVNVIFNWINMDHVFERERAFLPANNGYNVVDFERGLQNALGFHAVPHLLAFDGSGKRILSTYNDGPEETAQKLDAFCQKTLGKSSNLVAHLKTKPSDFTLSDGKPTVADLISFILSAAGKLYPDIPSGDNLKASIIGESANNSEGFYYKRFTIEGTSTKSRTVWYVSCGRGMWSDFLVALDGEKLLSIALVDDNGRPAADEGNSAGRDSNSASGDSSVASGDSNSAGSDSSSNSVQFVEKVFAPLTGRIAEDIGGTLSAFFSGLSYLPGIAQGRTPEKLVIQAKEPVLYPMKVEQLPPVIGDGCPDFRGIGLDGLRVSQYNFKDKPFIVLLGSLDDGATHQAQQALYALADDSINKIGNTVDDKAGFVEIYTNGANLLLDYIRRGFKFRGRAIADPEKENFRKFRAPYVPYILCYDKEHKLKMFTRYKGMKGTEIPLQEFLKALEIPATGTSATGKAAE
jgi:hypothetical protein